MPNDSLLYWDSSVFIDLIEKTPGRFAILEAIVQDAEQGKARIITSALTLAEVSKLKNLGLLPEWKEKLLIKFFENEFIAVRNLDRVYAEHSRAIIRNHGLKPPDAIHIATALFPKVDVLHTYDTDHLIRLDRKIVSPEGGSPLRIEEPHWDFQPSLGLFPTAEPPEI